MNVLALIVLAINPVPPVTPVPQPQRVIVVNSASIGVAGGSGLTDAQLRASPVSVGDGAGAFNVIVDSATLGTVTVSDGAGALNVIVDSATLGTVIVSDGAGALNSIIDSGTLTSITNPVSVTDGVGALNTIIDSGSVTVSDGAGALNVIVDSATLGTVTVTDGAGSMNVIVDSTAGLTDAQLRASAVTVGDGLGALNVIVDSGTVTVSDGAGALNTIIDSGSVTASISQTGTANDVDVLTLPSVTVGAFPDNEPINVAQINGVVPLMGNGASGTGAQRVTLASDSTGVIATVTTVTAVTSITNAVTTAQATAANLNAEVQGDTAHSAVVSGNPIQMGAYVEAEGAALDSSGVVEGDVTRLKADIQGRLLVSITHPNRFVCSISSTATTSTVITGCTTPGAGLTLYITDLSIGNSAATGVNAGTLQSGTGASCGTGTIVHYRCQSMASASCESNLTTPIKITGNSDLCFLSATAGTKAVTVTGYIAPP